MEDPVPVCPLGDIRAYYRRNTWAKESQRAVNRLATAALLLAPGIRQNAVAKLISS